MIKKIISVTSHALDPPPVTNNPASKTSARLSTNLGPLLTLERDVLCGRPL